MQIGVRPPLPQAAWNQQVAAYANSLFGAERFGGVDPQAAPRGPDRRRQADDGHQDGDGRQDHGAVTLEALALENLLEADGAQHPERRAGTELEQRAREDAAENLRRIGTERRADPDLFPTPRDRKGH